MSKQQIVPVLASVNAMLCKRRRSWTVVQFCRQDADHSFVDIFEQEIDFRWVPVPNNDELDADAAPFQPRFLFQEIIFAHCPYFPQPCLRGNLLCRADWLCLRRIAGCECAILPIQEIATNSKCSVCDQANSGERTTARRSLAAPEQVNKFSWQPATTNSMQTLCHSSRGSFSKRLFSLTVRMSLTHPSEEFC